MKKGNLVLRLGGEEGDEGREEMWMPEGREMIRSITWLQLSPSPLDRRCAGGTVPFALK